MDENLNNNPVNNRKNEIHNTSVENDQRNNSGPNGNTMNGVNNFSMDESGKIRSNSSGAASLVSNARIMIILGWVSAAFTAFISPYFAIPGILFGVLANRQSKGSGNAVIITNVVLAAINIIFGLFLIMALRRVMFGY